MPTRIAGACALLGFAIAILLGLAAENTFATTVWRALVTMAGTFAVGLVLGAMLDKMAQESQALRLEKKEKSSGQKPGADR